MYIIMGRRVVGRRNCRECVSLFTQCDVMYTVTPALLRQENMDVYVWWVDVCIKREGGGMHALLMAMWEDVCMGGHVDGCLVNGYVPQQGCYSGDMEKMYVCHTEEIWEGNVGRTCGWVSCWWLCAWTRLLFWGTRACIVYCMYVCVRTEEEEMWMSCLVDGYALQRGCYCEVCMRVICMYMIFVWPHIIIGYGVWPHIIIGYDIVRPHIKIGYGVWPQIIIGYDIVWPHTIIGYDMVCDPISCSSHQPIKPPPPLSPLHPTQKLTQICIWESAHGRHQVSWRVLLVMCL